MFAAAEIIVVSNACSDETAAVVAEHAAADPGLRLIDVAERLGKGGAVRLGFHAARGDVVAFVDADGATPPAELERLISELGSADCVIASRWIRGARVLIHQPPLRRFLGRAFNVIVRLMFGMRYADTQCGAKVFKRAALEEIIEDVETADFAFDVDLLYQLHRRGRIVREAPSLWCDRAGSTINTIVTAPKMLASIVRLRLTHSPCRYAIPIFDRLFGNRAIKCRRRVRVLVVANDRSSDGSLGAISTELRAVVDAYRGDRREVTWWAPTSSTIAGIEYLRRHRSTYDCVVEVAPNGRRWFMPLFTSRPILVVAPHAPKLRWPYAHVEHIDGVPDQAALELAVRRAMARSDAYFLLEADGTWTFEPKRAEPSRPSAAANRTPVPAISRSTTAFGSQ